MRVDSREFPLSAIPLCQLLPCHLGPPRPKLSINLSIKGRRLHHWSVPHVHTSGALSFRMRSRSSMPSRASSSLDLVVPVPEKWRKPFVQISPNSLILSAEKKKMWVAFALQKLLTSLQQKYQCIWKYLSYTFMILYMHYINLWTVGIVGCK